RLDADASHAITTALPRYPAARTVVIVELGHHSSIPNPRRGLGMGIEDSVVIFAVRPSSSPGPFDNSTSAVAIIPARSQSSRFPGKALAEIDGRPMIEHVYRRAAAAKSIASVIVATDDERIREAVAAFGGEVRMTSPHHPSGTDRIA